MVLAPFGGYGHLTILCIEDDLKSLENVISMAMVEIQNSGVQTYKIDIELRIIGSDISNRELNASIMNFQNKKILFVLSELVFLEKIEIFFYPMNLKM